MLGLWGMSHSQPTPEQDLALARASLARGDMLHAASHLAAALASDPVNPRFLETAEALLRAAPENAAELIPLRDGAAWFGDVALHAWLLARTGNATPAMRLLLQVVAAKPEVPYLSWAREWLASPDFARSVEPLPVADAALQLLRQVDLSDHAPLTDALREVLARVRAVHGDSGPLMLAAARLARDTGRFQESLDIALAYEREHPDSLAALAAAGAYRCLGDVPAAVAAYLRALERDPENPSPWLDIGDLLWKSGRAEEALDAYSEMLAHEPEHPWALPSALLLRAEVEGDPALVRDFLRYAQENPDNARASQLQEWLSAAASAPSSEGEPWVDFLPGPTEATLSVLLQLEAARERLESIARLESRSELEHGLADPELEVRDACAKALARVAPASALPTLVERGSIVSLSVLSLCAQAAVAALGAGALAWVVKSGLSPLDGKAAWAALYDLDPRETSKVLEQGLMTGTSSWALGVSDLVCAKGGEWARPAFSVLARLPDGPVKIAAAEALAKVGDETRVDVVLALLGTAGETWPRDVTVRLAFLMGRRTETPVAERVIAATGPSVSEQRQLMEELTRLAGSAWEASARAPIEGAVRKALAHSDDRTVTAAVRAATAWGFDALVDEVVATFHPPERGDPSVRTDFFLRAGALEVLRRALDHADMKRRRDAADVLGRVGEARALPWLKPLPHDPEPSVRSAAERAIERLRTASPPSARAWLKPLEGASPGQGRAEQARAWPVSAPAERFFATHEAVSLRGRFLLQAGTSEEGSSRVSSTGFRYRLLERGAGSRVVWERWQPSDEGPPDELVVSDEGWSILRTCGHTHEVIAVSPAGDDAMRVLVHRPGGDSPSERAWRYGWEVKFRAFVLGGGRGDGLADAWRRSWPFFFQVEGTAFFAWRMYWGQRLVLDLTHETVLTEADPAWAALGRTMDEEEKRTAHKVLSTLSAHLDKVQAILSRRVRAPLSIQDQLGRAATAIYLVGLHRHPEALPLLRLWEALDVPASSRRTFAMGSEASVEAQAFRPLVHHALRLLGEEPQGRATYHFHTRASGRLAVAERVADRRARAAELNTGMSAEQVLQCIGSPDHIRQRSLCAGAEYRGTEEWEYDFRVADQWVTLRLTWEEQSQGSRMRALQEEPATWLESEQRVLELHGR